MLDVSLFFPGRIEFAHQKHMDSQFERLIEVNIRGRVFAICQSRGVRDPAIIKLYADILRQSIQDRMCDDCTPVEFTRILDEQAAWLESEIAQTRSEPEKKAPPVAVEKEPEVKESQPAVKPSSSVPEAKSMSQRLADQRAGMERLLEHDCVKLKLITSGQGKQYKHRLLVQDPKKAEQEIVAELRHILDQQVRKFIREHEGGPWNSAFQQHELHTDITSVWTLRSLVNLTKELLMEQKVWLKKNRSGLAGRLFGGKIHFK